MLSLTMRLFLKKRPGGKVKSDKVDKGKIQNNYKKESVSLANKLSNV